MFADEPTEAPAEVVMEQPVVAPAAGTRPAGYDRLFGREFPSFRAE